MHSHNRFGLSLMLSAMMLRIIDAADLTNAIALFVFMVGSALLILEWERGQND